MLLKRSRKALFVITACLVLIQPAFAAGINHYSVRLSTGINSATCGLGCYPFLPSFDRIVLTSGQERWLLLVCGFLILVAATTLRRKISRNRRRELANQVAKIEPMA